MLRFGKITMIFIFYYYEFVSIYPTSSSSRIPFRGRDKHSRSLFAPRCSSVNNGTFPLQGGNRIASRLCKFTQTHGTTYALRYIHFLSFFWAICIHVIFFSFLLWVVLFNKWSWTQRVYFLKHNETEHNFVFLKCYSD